MSDMKVLVSTNILPVDIRDIPSIMKGDKGDKGLDGRDGSYVQKAYKTYASMVADKDSIPTNSNVVVNNDPDKDKNAYYTYDGTEFTKSDFDPQGILTTVDVRLNQAVESASEYFQSQVADTITTSIDNSAVAYADAIEATKEIVIADAKAETVETIEKVIKIGGIPAAPFATKALMDASVGNDGDLAIVYDSLTDSGFYFSEGGEWKISQYNPENTMKDSLDEFKDTIIVTKTGKNLYDKNKQVINEGINSVGVISNFPGWSRSDYIPVVAGEIYTISNESRRTGFGFFSSKGGTSISSSDNRYISTTNLIAPLTAKYLVLNISSDLVTGSKVQVEKGSVATPYEEYVSTTKIKDSNLPEDVLRQSNLDAAIKEVSKLKEYEIIASSTNLFDKEDIIKDYLLSNTSGRFITGGNAAGWATSNFIPVKEGMSYTLSGTRARGGIAFFSGKDYGIDALYFNESSTMPNTVTAPIGANYAIFNLYDTIRPNEFSNIQFEEGSIATPYVDYYKEVRIKSDYIQDVKESDNQGNTFKVDSEGNAALSSKQGDVNVLLSMRLGRPFSYERSDKFNFVSDYVDGNYIKSSLDDVAPLRADRTTIGANHGYMKTNIVSIAHGKSDADVGSVWSDGTKEYVIIYISSVDSITVTAREDNLAFNGSTLTHVSGANNTDTFTASSSTSQQWFPPTKNHKLVVNVDGVIIDNREAKTYDYNDTVAVHESYDIMTKTDIVEWIIANSGVAHTSYDAEESLLYNCSYVFDKEGGCTIYTSVTAYKTVPFIDYMGTQAIRFNEAEGRKYYVPKSIPFTSDSLDFDFASIQPMASTFSTPLFFGNSRNEVDANPVDRLIMFNEDLGMAIGYLPLYDAEPSIRKSNASNKYIEIRNSTLKVYPRLIDSASITTLSAGDSFAGIAYRKYFKKGTRTAKYVVRSNIADFLYLDWHSAKMDKIELPDDLIGREFTVHEKSSNVTLLSKFATSNIVINVDSTKSYGYLVLRFDK